MSPAQFASSTPARRRTAQRGLTLIELLVAVVIVGILASVAAPSFMNKMRQSRRTDAMDMIVQILQAQERWRGMNPAYTTTLANLGIASNATGGGYYTAAIAAVDADTPLTNSYVITMTAHTAKSQKDDAGCTPLTVTVRNGNPTYGQPTCWSR